MVCALAFLRTGGPACLAAGAPYDPQYLMVTGNVSPDATGLYVATDLYNGNTWYTRETDGAYHLWRSNTGLWTSSWTLSKNPPTGAWSTTPYWVFGDHLIPVGGSNRTGGGASSTAYLAVYDPEIPAPEPVLLPIPVGDPAPQWPSRILISGTLTPDATGIYSLSPATYKDLPVWVRDGDGAFAIWAINKSIWRLSVATNNTSAGYWKWDYKMPGKDFTTAAVTYTGVAGSVYADPDFPTPAQYLAGVPAPVFKAGHTLPRLTRFGWQLSVELNQVLADWGYTLDFVDATEAAVARMNQPNTYESRILALAESDPERYKLSLNMARLYEDNAPDAAYCTGTNGLLVIDDPDPKKTFSPQAPDEVLAGLAATTTCFIAQVAARVAPVVILNGGERGSTLYGHAAERWKQDPAVWAGKGDLSWSDYQSQRKYHEEMFFTEGMRDAAPGALYVWYHAGGNAIRNFVYYGNWWLWDWDYRFLQGIADLPSTSSYFKDGNKGWTTVTGKGTDGDDLLTKVLNGFGRAASYGRPLSYNWLCGGWAEDPAAAGNSDLGLYTGFLKTYYTAGMIGGNAGYYRFPTGGFNALFDKDAPPNWLRQIEVLGQVHAEFSYLEDMLRDGDLLPGPMRHRWSADQPAYEFWTGFYNTRVLIRKKRGEQRWLVCAWAADAVPRTVEVTLPPLGVLSLEALPAACLYDVRMTGGTQAVACIDAGLLAPSPLVLPENPPDADPAPYPTVALTASAADNRANVGDTVVLTAWPSNLTAAVASAWFLANDVMLNTNAASTVCEWRPTVTGNYSVVAVVNDAAGNMYRSGPLMLAIGGESLKRYLLTAFMDGPGRVAGAANGWYTGTTNLTLTAEPERYYRLDRWTGDVPPGEADANPIDVFLDRDLRIRAAALPNLATNGVPEWWLAGYGWTNAFSAAALDDPDGDGMETWKEYHADTVPTQALSVLRITGLTYAADTLRLEWTGGIQAWQSVEACTNLLAPAWEVVWSNAAPNTEENSLVHPDLPAPATFFRLRSGR